jgi:hypothetical protein
LWLSRQPQYLLKDKISYVIRYLVHIQEVPRRVRRDAPALRPDRKSSEGRQRLQSRLNVPQIDFGLEKRDLIIERDLVDIDVPGPGSAVAPVTPAVAAPF